jgi:galactokinase
MGITAAIQGNISIGAGLSSSAAFEVSLANLILRASKLTMHPKALAMIAFESERVFCKVSCGIQDQFASNLCKPDSLLGIHAATMQTQNIPVPPEIAFITIDSMIKRQAGKALNERRIECQRALTILQEAGFDISSICALNQDDLSTVEDLMEESLFQRVKHLVEEHARVVFAIDALNAGKFQRFGEIMYESHRSSRDLYEVSHENLDLLVNLLKDHNQVFGARLTGAGLGGAVVACVAKDYAQEVLQQVQHRYEEQTGITAEGMACTIPGGAITWSLTG